MIQTRFRILFNFIISLSLVLVPCYSYPQSVSNEGFLYQLDRYLQNQNKDLSPLLSQIIHDLRDRNKKLDPPPRFQKATQILFDLGKAMEEGRFEEYLEQNSELREQFDILSLNNQEVHVIDQRTGEVEEILDFNHYSPKSYPTFIKNIEIGFDEKTENLIFKGITVFGDDQRDKEMGLVHHFKSIRKSDVVDWAYDKEFLAILHKTKGIMLFHMVLARTLLGETPIASIVIPNTVYQKKNIKIEFINRAVESPLKHNNPSDVAIVTNLEGELVYEAGDLMVSTRSSKGKEVVRVFSRRDELDHLLFSKYVILQFLEQLVTVHIENPEDVDRFNENAFVISQKNNQTGGVFELLSSILNREPLLFLTSLSDRLSDARNLLLFSADNRDVFSHTDWEQNYKTLKSRLEANKYTGEVPSTETIVSLLSQNKEEQNQEDTVQKKSSILGDIKNKIYARSQKFRDTRVYQKIKKYKENQNSLYSSLKSRLQPIKALYQSMKDGKADWIITAIAGLWALHSLGSYIHDFGDSYTRNATFNIVFFGAALLFLVAALAKVSIPFLKKVNKIIPKGIYKTRLNQTIEKWEDKSGKERVVGFGFQIAGFLLYAIWNRMADLIGQPHFFTTLSQGLNPFTKISPDSKLGQSVQLNKPTRLGVSLVPQWEGVANLVDYSLKTIRTEADWPKKWNEQIKQRETLTSVSLENHKRIRMLSRVLTYYALLGEGFKLSDLLSGVLIFNIRQEKLHNLFSNKKKIGQFLWISRKLQKYIEQQDETDPTKQIFTLDPAIIKDYFVKAIELTERSQAVSMTRHQINFALQKMFTFFRALALWNSEESNMLKKSKPEKNVSNLFWIQLIMDHITLTTFPLTPTTPRGVEFVGSTSLGIDNNVGYLFSSPPHFQEGVLNIGVHTVYSARSQLQYLGEKESLKKNYEEFAPTYKPMEVYTQETNNEQTTLNYLKEFFKYPFTSWGTKLDEGENMEENIDVGSQLWKFIKLNYQFFQVTFLISFLARLAFTNQSVMDSFSGSLYFMAGGFVFYGWPMVWTIIHNFVEVKKMNRTKEVIDHVKFTSSKLERKIYASDTKWRADVISVLASVKDLFSSFKKLKKIDFDGLDPTLQEFFYGKSLSIKNYVRDLSIEDAHTIMNQLASSMTTPHLPTKSSTLGLSLVSLLALGIFSNIAFVYLSVESFSGKTMLDGVVLAIATVLGILAAKNITTKTVSEYKNWFKSKVPQPLRKAFQRTGSQSIEQVLSSIPEESRLRLINILKENDILTARDLMKYSEKDLLNIDGFGQTSVDLIVSALSNQNMQLKKEVQSSQKPGLLRSIVNKCQGAFSKTPAPKAELQ